MYFYMKGKKENHEKRHKSQKFFFNKTNFIPLELFSRTKQALWKNILSLKKQTLHCVCHIFRKSSGFKMPSWGGAPKCPACDRSQELVRKHRKIWSMFLLFRSVYPVEQVIAADRKAFHAGCIKCQMQGCG